MIDVHSHIDRYKDPNAITAETQREGVYTIAMTNLPSHFLMGLPHVRNYSKVQLALGFHPLAAGDFEQERTLFRKSFHMTPFIGEVGLDFSRMGKVARDVQLANFRLVAETISKAKKVISLHSREAESTVLDILSEFEIPIAIFHWYSGPLRVMDEVVSQGHFFSVNPAMLRSGKGQQIISRIPSDRLLTETDGPYVKIEGIPARPWDVVLVEKYLSKIWAIQPEEARERVRYNFRQMLIRLGLLDILVPYPGRTKPTI
jgi:TatD DNase family protein